GALKSSAGRSPCVPSVATLTRSVVGEQPGTATPLEKQRSRTKTSVVPFVSPATKFVWSLPNATKRPSADTAGGPRALPPLGCPPSWVRLTTSVAGVHPDTGTPEETQRSRRTMAGSVAPGAMSDALVRNATQRPSAEMLGDSLVSSPATAPGVTLT